MLLGKRKYQSLSVQAFERNSIFSGRQIHETCLEPAAHQCAHMLGSMPTYEAEVRGGMRVGQISPHFVNNAEVDQRRVAQVPCSGVLPVGGTRSLYGSIFMRQREPGFRRECFA
jgi:hypothetical protein